MYTYDVNCLRNQLDGILQQHVEAPAWSWLQQNKVLDSDAKLNFALRQAPD